MRALTVLWSVSVSTKVPATNVTPTTIAREVRAKRNLWASRPLIVTLRISGRQLAHALKDAVGGRALQLVHELPVGKEDHPVGISSCAGVVGHHHHRLAHLSDRAAEE